ncbi:MAG: heme-binding protein, partial [Candidatus Zixiibacteriota bacterium]
MLVRANLLMLDFVRRHKSVSSLLLFLISGMLAISIVSCDSDVSDIIIGPVGTPDLTITDVETLITRAVELADRNGTAIAVAVVDREGNVLGVFRMTGVTDPVVFDEWTGAIAKGRTAVYLSSNSHAFTSLTACFITRPHFPPGISNTPGGPLYG